ncbi:alpha/beta fold hydrolase [Saccharospirillum sp.]|uniref:alpha/beta fold hydrolase n=1 Tax=Saccharospirillum sp. TaxID=2033801 RepID=UPI00349FDED2
MTGQPITLTVNGVALEACWYGPPPHQSLTLVLLHEGLGSVGQWKHFPEQLARTTGCGVLVYSRAGYGQSDPVALPRPLTYMHNEARDVLPRLLDAAHIRDAVLVGHSDGASIALINAGTQQDPRIKGLVLMAPHVFTEPMCLASIRDARTAYEDTATHLRDRLAHYHRHVDVAFKGWNDAWLDPDFESWNLEGFVGGITGPMLLIQGRQDEYGTHKQLDAIVRRAQTTCEILWLDDCRHSPHRDQPEATLAAIQDFIQPLFQSASTQETFTHG